jgi:hypothetical protein
LQQRPCYVSDLHIRSIRNTQNLYLLFILSSHPSAILETVSERTPNKLKRRRCKVMKGKNWVVVLVVVGVLALALGGGAAFAHEETAPNEGWEDMESYCHEEMEEMMSGWGTGSYHMGLNDPVTLSRVADALNLTYEELTTRLAQGETIARVAQTEGIGITQVVATVLAPHSEVLQVFINYGHLDETQAQAILEQAKERVEQAITQPLTRFYAGTIPEGTPGPSYGWGGHGMMGGGMMGGW